MIINCRDIVYSINKDIESMVKRIKERYNTIPGLAIIHTGNDYSSNVYMNNIIKLGEAVGMNIGVYNFKDGTVTSRLVNIINNLNNDSDIYGIIVETPLPYHIDQNEVFNSIDPSKDIDAKTIINLGKILAGEEECFLPCTVSAVIKIIDSLNIDLTGKNCVILGRSINVGRILAIELLKYNPTITICHSYTNNLKDITSKADILISSIGSPKFITEDMVKDNAIVIDVGINKDNNGKICGDIDFDNVKNKASYITQVPNGVGSITTSMLLYNTLHNKI